MKKLFTILAVAAAVVACQKNEIVALDKGEAIAFGNAFVENSTRATDPSYGAVALTKFNVYGTVTGTGNGVVNIFAGDEVTGTVGNDVWTCANKQYWIADASYNFAAVASGNVATTDTNGMPATISTIANANNNVEDLLYATATATGKASGNGKVNFTFDHMLSKAFFTVTSNTEGGYYYSVKNIKVANYSEGTYTVGGSWAGTTAADVAFGNIENVTAADNNKTNATQMLLIPTTDDFKVTFTVDLYKGTTKLGTEAKTIPVETDLVKGNSYNFTIACSVGNPIKFTVTNDPAWKTTTDVTVQ